MEKVKIIFGRSNKVISRVIRLVTFSRWSHVGIVAGDWVYESTGTGGVIKTPLEQFKGRYKGHWEICEIHCESLDICYTRAKSLLGSPYDLKSLFGYLFRMDFDTPSAWQCSEFVAHCLAWVRKDKLWRISPEYLWLASNTVERGHHVK